jgi:class 3 adenylate cyclase/tetratricopeptide (TPR) repeat protein
MQCSRCAFENPAGMKFCGNCGARLALACSSCGAANPPDFRFCGSCGAQLSAAAPTPSPRPAPPSPEPLPVAHAAAERRQLTVMFCDLVGSTALSARLDPEELRDIVGLYQEVCATAIETNEGYIAQYLGDGVLAYFGYPKGSEREASRAVRAGLAVVRGVRALGERLERERGLSIAVRVGLHTGVVVIGEIGAGQKRESLALGETPNLAARIQALARANTVLVSADTSRLVQHEFEFEDLGPQTLSGIPAPVRVHVVTRDLAEEPWRPAPMAPSVEVVGRQQELGILRDRWERVRAGSGQVVVVSGDAGIGKSSLMHAFAESLETDVTRLEARCLPYFRSTAYQPVVELVHRALGCPPEERPEQKLVCLGSLLERQGLPVDDMLPLFSRLLALPCEPAPADDGRTPAQHRERTRAALFQLLVGAAAEGPMVLVVEDLHWADPSTLELLAMLVRHVPTQPILALFSHRTEFQPPWGSPAHQTQLSLTRLQEGEAQRIIDRLADGKALPEAVVAQILARTDGVPLFVEELTKTVLESGLLHDQGGRWVLPGGALPPLAIPTTLHDSLEARLDRLSATKELAQLGAVLGREFGYALLRAVSDLEEPALRAALSQLVDAELLYQRGLPPTAVYTFKHALVQEAAYQSLLKGVRQTWHQRAAMVLEERFPDEAASHPERVAQHYTAAGLAGPAVDAWVRAGRRAVERSGHHEAVAHLRQAVELLPELPAGPERDGRELALLLALGPALTATEGHAAREVRQVYLRALELAEALGVEDEHLEVMGGLFASYSVRGELEEASKLAHRMLGAAAKNGPSRWEGAALVAVGISLLKSGPLTAARDHLERGIACYDPARDFALAHTMGQDYGVVGWCYSAFAHFALGFADEALRRARRAAALARELAHPHSLAFALSFNSSVHFFRREPAEALEVVAEMEEIAEREGFRHWKLDVPPMRAWALAALGRTGEALAVLDGVQADELVQGMGVGSGMNRVRVLAEAFLEAGLPGRADPLLERLRDMLEAEAPDIWWKPEVYRLEGAALAQLGRVEQARAELEAAVRAARAVETPVLVLRALVALARVLGEVDTGLRAHLEEACLTIPEPGDLRDLAEARALLATPETPPAPDADAALAVA